MTEHRPSSPTAPSARRGSPSCHGGVSSLLRTGLPTATPQRRIAPVRSVAERPLFLSQRAPSTQLSLFGPAGSR